MNKFTLLLCLSLSTVLLQNCARNPVTGKRQVVLMSEAQEIAMGQEADPQIVAQFGLYDDKSLQQFITEKGNQMVVKSHRPNIKYEFKILDSDVLNAFAVPGGYVYFTRGIMAHFNNEAQFAGVLGHETGHITARHTVTQQRNATLGQFGVIAGAIAIPEFGQYAQTASQGLGLLFLKFGRDAERQADKLGVEYSSLIGYDAKQMADFFKTLERQSEGNESASLPVFLSSHPDPGDRYTAVNKLAVEWKQKLNLTDPIVNRNTYLQRIDGLVYGADPRQGYLENDVFYHPVLKFQFPTPAGWNYQNSPQQVQLASKDGKAVMLLSLAAGKDLRAAASNFIQQNGLQALQSNEVTVNGLPAIATIAEPQPAPQQQQQQQAPPIRILSYLIQYNDAIYSMVGFSARQDFDQYFNTFQSNMQGFKILTDQAKINKKPERIRIKTINNTQPLQSIFQYYKVPPARYNELAILNGMLLNESVTKGMMVKIVGE